MSLCAYLGERDIWVPFKPLQTQVFDSDGFEGRQGLTWPERVVQLIESKDRSLGHPRNKRLQGRFGGLEQVTIDKKQANKEVWVGFHEGGSCFRDVALDQLHLWDVSQKAVAIVFSDQREQLVV